MQNIRNDQTASVLFADYLNHFTSRWYIDCTYKLSRSQRRTFRSLSTVTAKVCRIGRVVNADRRRGDDNNGDQVAHVVISRDRSAGLATRGGIHDIDQIRH